MGKLSDANISKKKEVEILQTLCIFFLFLLTLVLLGLLLLASLGVEGKLALLR